MSRLESCVFEGKVCERKVYDAFQEGDMISSYM